MCDCRAIPRFWGLSPTGRVGECPSISTVHVSTPAYARVVANSWTQSRARERIERLCAAPSDTRTLRLQVLEELRRAVGYDAYVWLLTDPSSTVGCAPIADVPAVQELPLLIRFKYLTAVNRWTALAAQSVKAASLHQTTAGELSRSLVWKEVLASHGIRDIASSVFADRHGCWSFLDLWRSEGSDTFAEDEIAFLAELAPVLTRALRERQSTTFVATAEPRRRSGGPVVLLLGDDLSVRSQTEATKEWLRVLLPPAPDQPTIPAGVYNVAAQLLAAEQGIDSHEAFARVHLSDGFWLTLRAARIDTNIAVTLEESSPVERLEVFARAHGLSERERELLSLLAHGSDTRQIAERMFLSEHTVQDHLKSVFAKTADHNRRTLVARILGTRFD